MVSPVSTITDNTIVQNTRALKCEEHHTAQHIRAEHSVPIPSHPAEPRTDVSLAGTVTDAAEKPHLLSKLSQYFLKELNPRRADIILVLCGFVGGLVDGLSFNAWGSFSSMQTGI
jgi:hypothetical protein